MKKETENITSLRFIAFVIIVFSAVSIIILYLRMTAVVERQNDQSIAVQVRYFDQINTNIGNLLESFLADNEAVIQRKITGDGSVGDVPVFAYYQGLIDGYMLIDKDHMLVQGEGELIALDGFKVCLTSDEGLEGVHTCPVSMNTVLYTVIPVMMEAGGYYYVLFYKLISRKMADEIADITGQPVRFVEMGQVPEELPGYLHSTTVLKSFEGRDLIQLVSYYPRSVLYWLRINFGIMLVLIIILSVLAYILTTLGRVASLSRSLEEKNRELRQLSDEKENLLRVLSHDLKNYISPIFGYSDLIEMDGDLGEENREMLKHIRNSAEQQDRIIELVREQLALGAGKLKPELQPMEVGPLIDKLLEDFKFRLEEKNIRVVISDEVDCCRVMADPLSFSVNILNNLLSNAIKFSPEGERINIGIENSGGSRDMLEIFIRDRGIGIPDEILNNIWDSSVKTTRDGTEGEKGTGFGMPLVKKYMQAYGGDIRIESRAREDYPGDSGTTVYLMLKKA